jgi:signal transduction histidine kinase
MRRARPRSGDRHDRIDDENPLVQALRLTLLVPILVAAAAAATIVALHHRADAARRGEITLAKIGRDANELRALETDALLRATNLHERVERHLREIKSLRATLDRRLEVLSSSDRDEQTADLVQSFRTFLGSFDAVLADLRAHRLGAALAKYRALGGQTADLQAGLGADERERRDRAQRETTIVDVGTVVTLLLAALIIGAVITRLARARIAAAAHEVERRALAFQNEQLRDLDRLKDDFVASVSHELRTPLTSIQGYLELVLEGEAGEVNDEQRHFLSIVRRNSDRLLRLVGDLLFVAQIDAGKLEIERDDVDLQAVVEESVQSARPRAAEGGLALELEAQPVPHVVGDRVRLAQLLDNLVSNALKFTPAGGRVVVRLRAEGQRAVVEVEDTGAGISAADQERLFERFFRTASATERAVQGTGLGLSIAKAIAEGHGGTIAVRSAEGAGTTFRIELPLVPVRHTAEASA